jgi:hypothetical protein
MNKNKIENEYIAALLKRGDRLLQQIRKARVHLDKEMWRERLCVNR